MDLLLVTTIGHVVSSVILLLSGALVLFQGPTKIVNRTFSLTLFGIAIFGISLALGINLDPSPFAYWVWFINLIDVLIIAVYLHFTFAVLGKQNEAKWLIRGVYAIGAVIAILAVLNPTLFIPEISSKLFTKSYLNPGPLYITMFIYFASVFFMSFVTFVYAYFSQEKNRKQIEYFLLTTILGFGTGSIDFFLVFDIPISPLYGMFFGFSMVPMAYGVLADQLMDIRIVIKKAFIYSIIIGAIAAVLTLLTFLSDLLVTNVPWVQFWTIPIFTAFIAFIIGRLFWLKSIENDRIKYEFVNIATHKLRTPLTQISWRVRELIEKNPSSHVADTAYNIQRSTNRLIELTNIIFETTQDDTNNSAYTKEKIGLVAMTREILDRFKSIIEKKKLVVNIHVDDEVYIYADKRRIHAVIEVLIENAINYTPEGGFVQVIVYNKKDKINYSVRDSGIGVSSVEKSRIFSRFYRTDDAKRIDTEGVGLGLAMAKSIIRKHRGQIGVESQGKDKGSIFWFTLPKNKPS